MKVNSKEWPTSGAIFSNGKELYLGYGQFRWKKFSELDESHPAFYFPDFFLTCSHPWLQFHEWTCLPIQDFEPQLILEEQPPLLQWKYPKEEIFYQQIKKLKNDFSHTPLKKAVPYLFATCSEKMNSHRLVRCLKNACVHLKRFSGYLYGFWNQDEGILGVTPELLFQFDERNRKLKTMALAGTCPKGRHFGEKEINEHQIVVEGIKLSLQSLGELSIGTLQTLNLSRFYHLQTDLYLKLDGKFHFENIVQRLHPTPALGAFPKDIGWDWLKNYEIKVKRKRYGAPVGILFKAQNLIQSAVAIRNVQWDRSGLKIGAGCGVVLESDEKKEWEELCLKLNAIKENLFA